MQAGTVIPAALITGIRSDLPGQITAQVTEAVYDSPTGKYLLAANQDSENVVVFHLDPATGRLTPTGQTIEVGAPVCVLFVPVGT